MKIHRLVHLALLPAVLAPGLALATNGYESPRVS